MIKRMMIRCRILIGTGVCRTLLFGGLILPMGMLGWPWGKLHLARQGKTDYVIVQANAAKSDEVLAAKELQTYLEKATGARMPVVSESNLTTAVKGIYVGWTDYALKHGIDASKLEMEEWIIRTMGKNLVLTGGRQAGEKGRWFGTLYAVYEFLESQAGCHWLDRDTEVIPYCPDLAISTLNIRAKPVFWNRSISPGYSDYTSDMSIKEGRFRVCNKSVGWPATPYWRIDYGSPGGCHTFYAYSKDFPTNHPEYFSMDKDGKRERAKDDGGPGQLCLTNPDMRKLMLAQLKKFIAQDRENTAKDGRAAPWVYDISQNDDHRPICLCPTCRAFAEKDGGRVIVDPKTELADSSALLIDFINELADGIRAEYPDVLIMTFAYSQTLKPPKTLKPRDNVIIRLAQLNSEWAYAPKGSEKDAHFPDLFRPMSHPVNRGALEDLTGWSKISKHLAIWDYWILYSPNDKFPTPYVNVACLQPDLRLFLNNHVEDVIVECEDPHTTSFSALKLWLGQKLLQDPNQPAEPLLQTFMAGYYGAAAPKMREYLDYMEKRIAAVPATEEKISSMREHLRPYLDLEFFKTARGLLTEAEQACGPDTNALFHVRHEWIPVDAAINNMWLQLKGQLPSGETMPFDRQTIVKQYCDTRLAQMERFYYGKIPDKIKEQIEKELKKYREMPDVEKRTTEAPPQVKVPALSVPGDGDPVKVDWSKALTLDKWFTVQGNLIERKPSIRLVHDARHLYVRLTEPCDTAKLTVGGDIWSGDDWEVFFTAQRDKLPYRQVCIGPEGKTVAYEWNKKLGEAPPAIWENNARIISDRSNNCWTVSLAFPLEKLLPGGVKVGDKFYANFFRATPKPADHLAWSPSFDDGFHMPARFGELILE